MTIATSPGIDLESVERLSRDLAQEARGLSVDDARYLVDAFYTMQDARIRAQGQVRAAGASGESNLTIQWLQAQNRTLETQVQRALDQWTDAQPVGQWLKSIHGIGPIIAAGLLAHIDIEKAPTVGHIWRFAGLDPTAKWEKGQKRPHNARLKVLCWKMGDSFMKHRAADADVYGKVYAERKAWELERNERGEYAEQAREALATRKFQDKALKAVYESGRLPLGRIELRARRYAVKLLLAHLHEVMWTTRYNTPAPVPYVLTLPGHAHKIEVPNWPMVA